jgi:hypothetical protein
MDTKMVGGLALKVLGNGRLQHDDGRWFWVNLVDNSSTPLGKTLDEAWDTLIETILRDGYQEETHAASFPGTA